MILITSYFKDVKRDHEFLECLKKNAMNKHITKIKLFIEDDEPSVKSDKIELIHWDQPTYKDFFDQIEEGAVNIIANSDIFFNDSVISCNRIREGQCYAITRHERLPDGNIKPFNQRPEWSQDVWVLRRKPKNIEKYEEVGALNLQTDKQEKIPFYLGVAGCDNHVAFLLGTDFAVSNPYTTIKCIHIHEDTSRDYKMKYRINGGGAGFGRLRPVKHRMI